LAFGSYIAWGFLSIFWKLLSGVDAYEVFSYRILSTMLTMLLYFLFFGRMKKLKTEISGLLANKSELLSMILASFLISINWLVFIYAVGHGQATAASLGYYINPSVFCFIGCYLSQRKVGKTSPRYHFICSIRCLNFNNSKWAFTDYINLLPISFGTYGLIKKNVTISSDVAMFVETIIVTPLY
jgi:chloramphenicol-sensitive protein RarD